jgi:hypothetical protein
MDLIGLLQRPEGKTLEFKRDLSSPEKVLHTLIAFANTAGGLLVIGVENGTKRVRGLLDPLKEEERLASLISDRIAPRLIPTVDVIAWHSAQLIVVEVLSQFQSAALLEESRPRGRRVRAHWLDQSQGGRGVAAGATSDGAERNLRRIAAGGVRLGSAGLPSRFRVVPGAGSADEGRFADLATTDFPWPPLRLVLPNAREGFDFAGAGRSDEEK